MSRGGLVRSSDRENSQAKRAGCFRHIRVESQQLSVQTLTDRDVQGIWRSQLARARPDDLFAGMDIRIYNLRNS